MKLNCKQLNDGKIADTSPLSLPVSKTDLKNICI